MKRTILLTALTVLSSLSLLRAQNESEASTNPMSGLSLEDCIRIAKERNLNLRRQEIEQENRIIGLDAVRHSFLPSVNAGIGHNYSFGRSKDKTGVTVDRSSMNTNLSIGASVEVFSGTRRLHDLKQQKYNVEDGIARLQKACEDLSLQIAALYINLLFRQEMTRTAETQLALIREQRNRTAEMVRVGKWAEGKLLDIDAQMAKDEQLLVQYRSEEELARLDLGQALELEHPESITVKAPDTDVLVAERLGSLLAPEEIYRTALGLKPALHSSELQIASAREGLASARAAYFPTLSLSAGYSNGYFRDLGKEYAAINPSFSEQWKNNGSYSIGLSLNIPIFSAMQTQDRVRSSRLQVRSSELRLVEEKKTLYKEIRQAYSNAVAADKAIAAAENSKAATLKAYEYARDSFEAGRLSAYEYAEAKTKYALSQVEELRAKYDFIYKAKVLDFYQGKDF